MLCTDSPGTKTGLRQGMSHRSFAAGGDRQGRHPQGAFPTDEKQGDAEAAGVDKVLTHLDSC